VSVNSNPDPDLRFKHESGLANNFGPGSRSTALLIISEITAIVQLNMLLINVSNPKVI
jgi:hypothetical protein